MNIKEIMKSKCPKCGEESLNPAGGEAQSVGLVGEEFIVCEMCESEFDFDLKPIDKTKRRLEQIVAQLNNDEWAIIKGWFDYTVNCSDEYLTEEELKLGKLLGFINGDV